MDTHFHDLPARRTRPLWTFAIVSIALFMVVLDNLVVTTALPSIRADLGGGVQALEWTVNAYTLTFAVLLLTGAALGDRFGRRRMFVIGLGIFTARLRRAPRSRPSTGALIAARALQGAGAAIVTPLTLTLLSEAFPPEQARPRDRRLVGHLRPRRRARPARRRRRRRGHLVALDLLAQRPDRPRRSSRSPTRRLTESYGPAKQLDLPGLALGGLGLLGVVYGIVRGTELGWTSRTVLASLGRRRRAAGRVRRLGAAHAGARCCRCASSARRAFTRLQRRVAGDVLRRLRLDLPARPVLPGRPAPVAAGGRACARCRGPACR